MAFPPLGLRYNKVQKYEITSLTNYLVANISGTRSLKPDTPIPPTIQLPSGTIALDTVSIPLTDKASDTMHHMWPNMAKPSLGGFWRQCHRNTNPLTIPRMHVWPRDSCHYLLCR
ncbi:hypothetical protein CEXT_294631 [Caerostris extrusa]|uniref:Uncharacterized protein n=1 Tax=Caerostris extrusa TaxID=172846 RepID=A0AAV4RPJ3_CAEEX|nr:hypothetical protein CEXT_294631 [Caerostris extrusa]